MEALVGYSGSSSESDGDEEPSVCKNDGGRDLLHGAAPDSKTRNFLLEPASSESDQSDHEGPLPAPPKPRPAAPPPAYKLPPPRLQACTESSVFANPFKAQAERKLSALQKHVPLTVHAKPSQIGGKRICAAYRKDGRCRFGIKCKFAHDSDLQTAAVAPGDRRPAEGGPGVSDEPRREAAPEGSEGQRGKKRRVGVSDTLIPPKKAMKQYKMLRGKEKLNMY
ncbi:uncharacterized protein [Nerophis lumbriciformis]|uniref:uncharacterized protein n=1 Tax=Nerophis lumbriciformis TaxID=546530 RepID=UPI002AE040CF|nr:uncharacterized protein si:ch211-113e8.11 [Nerophis lumbriciformis]